MRKQYLSHGLIHLALLVVAVTTLFPFVWMLSTSLKDTALVFSYPPKLIPNPPTWVNYMDAWQETAMTRAMLNSMFIAITATAGNVVISSMVAYSFAKIDFRAKNALFLLILATIMVPYQVTLIPLFVVFKQFGWINTYYPLIVPALFGTASNVFLMRQYIMRIPDAYRDSAYIDGCGHIGIWWRIIMPMSIPMIVSIAVLMFMGKWNDFLGPMLYLSSPAKMTVPLVLRKFQTQYSTKWNMLMAASCIALAPVIILYMFSQKYIIGGIMLGGVKG
ncbi:MAG: carbohydrate ABC transporter permease [Oscillospiraceae bacterium]|jgi:ABC-type glycerol-3-phosphate transport system permease component|nr:carbohydrate ABC transporter permease [Oscillospiraceae bacterium]